MKLQNDKGRLEKVTGPHGKWYGDACAAAFAMELIGERWSLPIVRELMMGARRFTDIRASLPGLSAKTLTERLETLEGLGIVNRRKLAPPISAQVYDLSEWGRELEPVMQSLGRWAMRSALHDPQLPLTAVSLMLSMRTMLDQNAAEGLELWVAFEVSDEHYAARLRGGELSIHRAAERMPAPDLRFTAPSASDFLPVFYGKKTPQEAGGHMVIEGDPDLARRFIGLFSLPSKLPGICPAA